MAQNHVHFLGVPNLPAGDAKIFVIHCKPAIISLSIYVLNIISVSFMQPAPQNYGTFPDSHGKAASFFLDSGVSRTARFL